MLVMFGGQIMRPLYNKQIHRFIRFPMGEAKLRRTNWLVQRSLTQHTENFIKPAGKLNKGQSSGNKNFQTNRLVSQILIFKSLSFFDFYRHAYGAVVHL